MPDGARLTLDDIEVGHEFVSARRTVAEADIVSFSAATGDYSPLHADEVFIREHTNFRGRIAQGWLIVTIQSGLRCEIENWDIIAYLGMERSFRAPVYPGDTIHARYRVDDVTPSRSKPDRGVVILACDVVNQDGATVATGTETFMLARTGGS
jgi:acyl dehydratase